MQAHKLHYRVGGSRRCTPCTKFEEVCFPFIFLLQQRGPTFKFARQPPTTTLYRSFLELERSAALGCDICRIWRKALLNECFSADEEQELMNSVDEVQLRPPSLAVTPTRFDIEIVSPRHALVRRAYDDGSDGWKRWKPRIAENIEAVEFTAQEGVPAGPEEVPGSAAAIVHRVVRSENLRQTLGHWLTHCTSTHEACWTSSSFLPTRLIHIQDGTMVKVCNTVDLPQNLEYAALSYAWGGEQDLMLDSKNEASLRNGRRQGDYHRTIRDTFEICRWLDISYVWIDALCIRQGDGGEDFQKEAETMGSIYGCAKVTLVIASAKGAREGFLHDRNAEIHPVDPRHMDFADGQLLLQRKGLEEVRARSPLAKRGWCFQEEVLSKRLLYCTSHGFFWSCSKVQLAEHGNHLNHYNGDFPEHESVASVLDPHSFYNARDQLSIWDRLVNYYSRRDVSFAKDRLPAIRGLARLTEQRTGEDFLFGMWRSRMPAQLLWVTEGKKCSETKEEEAARLVLDAGIPSWSWAATPPTQGVQMPGARISHSRAKLLEVNDSAGATRLLLQGRFRTLLAVHVRLDFWPIEENKLITVNNDQSIWAATEYEIFIQEEGRDHILIQLDRRLKVDPKHLWCFEINYKGFLLLEPVGSDVYRRVGCCQLHDDSAFFALSPPRVIELE